MKATIVDLRYRMKEVLRAIDRGETVTVLYRGREKAELRPFPGPAHGSDKDVAKTEEQPFFGMWSNRDDLADPTSYLRNLREPRRVLVQPGRRKRSSTKKGK